MADKRRNLGIPSGVVFPFAGTTAPYGYLVCDGSEVSRASYPALFISLGSGTLHGVGDGSTTFNLPDYRGKFMRGVDGVAGNDPDKTTRTHPVSGAVVGNVVGSVQGHANESHTHVQDAHSHGLGDDNGLQAFASSGVQGAGGVLTPNVQGTPTNYQYNTTAAKTATNQDSGGNESRPKNVNVNYIVKV
jgi:microcystin-dependent protein